MISPAHVSNSPMLRHRSKSEPVTEMGGKMASASAPERITFLPGKVRRAIA